MVLNKVETNKTQTKKLIKQSIAKQDALKQRYATYSRTLHETEQAYQKAVNVSFFLFYEFYTFRTVVIIASWSIGNVIVSRTVGLRFKSGTGQIRRSAGNRCNVSSKEVFC